MSNNITQRDRDERHRNWSHTLHDLQVEGGRVLDERAPNWQKVLDVIDREIRWYRKKLGL